MVTTDGRVIGEHTAFITYGRAAQGLGVATGSPLYVLQIKETLGRLSSARTKTSTRGLCGRIELT